MWYFSEKLRMEPRTRSISIGPVTAAEIRGEDRVLRARPHSLLNHAERELLPLSGGLDESQFVVVTSRDDGRRADVADRQPRENEDTGGDHRFDPERDGTHDADVAVEIGLYLAPGFRRAAGSADTSPTPLFTPKSSDSVRPNELSWFARSLRTMTTLVRGCSGERKVSELTPLLR